ncbi:tetratricopeptide repeat protein [Marinomonas sp. 2405UD68-3]|uniref:tetratricopeptide repeat protein n=1 Tax=Marinomonas sp. 2405UD68-3 TaxID=3391835 RepID=UPI0039C8CC13
MKMFCIVLVVFLSACSLQPLQEQKQKERVSLSLAQEFVLTNQFQKAKFYLDKMDVSLKDKVEYIRINSLYLLKTNQLEDAHSYYQKSIKLFPKDGFLLNNFGIVLMRLGKYEEACIWFRKAVEFSVGHSQSALINLSRCLISKDDVKKASILMAQAKEMGKLPYIGLLTELNLVLIQGNNIRASQINKIIQVNTKYTQLIEYKEEFECLSRHVAARESDLTSITSISPSACIVPRYKI